MKDEYDDVRDMLQQMGHSEHEITKIVGRLRRYEKETQLDSVMDSIAAGRFNLKELIKEALEE